MMQPKTSSVRSRSRRAKDWRVMPSPRQLERFVYGHEGRGFANVLYNVPVLGRTVAGRVFRAGKGRLIPVPSLHLDPSPHHEHHVATELERQKGATVGAGCEQASSGLGHFALGPADRAVAVQGVRLVQVFVHHS